MEVVARVSVAKDFSVTPGPRGRGEGKFSGDEFLKNVLRPPFKAAVERGGILQVDLDGTEGYATSFLEAVSDHLRLKSDEEPYLVDEINKYIRDARVSS